MKDENTIYDAQPKGKMQDEQTQLDEQQNKPQDGQQDNGQPQAQAAATDTKKPSPVWRRVAVGGGTGFVLGAATTLFSSSTSAEPVAEATDAPETTDTPTANDHPAYVDDHVQVASTVNDGMSFGQAFQAARAELGPGGVFEWHGQVYNTYYAEEWDAMSPQQQAEFGSHFSWSAHDTATTDDVTPVTPATDDDVVVVTNDITNDDEDVAVIDPPTDDPYVTPVDNPTDDNPEVEILGVVHDDETGANVGGMIIDGHEAMVLDVDGDLSFDIMGVDINDNHEFEGDELADITDGGITVDTLGGFTPTDDAMADGSTVESDPMDYGC